MDVDARARLVGNIVGGRAQAGAIAPVGALLPADPEYGAGVAAGLGIALSEAEALAGLSLRELISATAQ